MSDVDLYNAIPGPGSKNHTLHDTNETPSGTIGIRGYASAAGAIVVVYRDDPDDTAVTHQIGVSNFHIPGRIKIVKSTGLTATISGTPVAEVGGPI